MSGAPLPGPNTLTASELEEFKEIFNLVDKDRSGSIDQLEFCEEV